MFAANYSRVRDFIDILRVSAECIIRAAPQGDDEAALRG